MKIKSQLPEEIEKLFLAKQNRRKELAKLPIEEKIRILVELQKIAYNLPKTKNSGKRWVWEISNI